MRKSSRRSQLVCQHLEGVSRKALEKHQEIIRQYVRGRQGVYALYRRNRLYYVGLATNLRFRLRQHLKDRHGQSWDRFSVYLTIGEAHLKELESLTLRIVRPPGNKQLGKFARSEDLRRRFRRDIRSYQQRELDELISGSRSPRRRRQTTPQSTRAGNAVLAPFVGKVSALRGRSKGKTFKARVKKGRIDLIRRKSLQLALHCRKGCPGKILQRLDLLELRTRSRGLGAAGRSAKVKADAK